MTYISEMTVKKLKEYCKKHGIRGYSKLRKAGIILLIQKKRNLKIVKKSRKFKKKSRKPKRKSRKLKKKSRKPKRKSRKLKKKSRKPKRKSRKLKKKSPRILSEELKEIKQQISKIKEKLKEQKRTQKNVQKQLNKDKKVSNPKLRLQQDIEYNEGLIQDIQKDINKLDMKRFDLNEKYDFLVFISKQLGKKEISIQMIHQLKYSISKLDNKDTKNKLLKILRRKQ